MQSLKRLGVLLRGSVDVVSGSLGLIGAALMLPEAQPLVQLAADGAIAHYGPPAAAAIGIGGLVLSRAAERRAAQKLEPQAQPSQDESK